MSGEFTEFTRAMTRRQNAAGQQSPTGARNALERVAVLGGGADACLLAALCLAESATVTLFSAYGSELQRLRLSSGITLRGAGPVGTYQVDRDSSPSIKTTAELDTAISDADVIFLTGAVHKQRTYAMVLASHVRDGQIIVLAPGRSLGALETAWHLRIGGCTADVTVVESQGLPFWIDAQGTHLHLSECTNVSAATLPSNRGFVIEQLKRFLPNIRATDSVLGSGLSDGSALVELPALLLGGPALSAAGVDIPMGAKPLPENHTFRSLIGTEQRAVIDQLAAERYAVASVFGVRNLPTVEEWIDVHAGVMRGQGSRTVPDRADAKILLRDGIVASLVPLLSAARLTETAVPVTQSMVTIGSSILGADVAAAGRRLDTIGIDASDIDSARRAMDAIAMGQR